MAISRLLRIAALAAPLALSCSSSSDAPATPITFSFDITKLDGKSTDMPVNLRCDEATNTDTGPSTRRHSTLAVVVAMTTDPENRFVLRPPQACGTSSVCGYVRFEALDSDDHALAKVDSATLEGVLELEVPQLPLLTSVRASLLHGSDDTIVKNPDGTEVVTVAKPTFVVPECQPTPTGSGGEGGQGGEPSQGGQPSLGGEPAVGGEGGSSQAGAPVMGGAGGESAAGAGGASAGGSP